MASIERRQQCGRWWGARDEMRSKMQFIIWSRFLSMSSTREDNHSLSEWILEFSMKVLPVNSVDLLTIATTMSRHINQLECHLVRRSTPLLSVERGKRVISNSRSHVLFGYWPADPFAVPTSIHEGWKPRRLMTFPSINRISHYRRRIYLSDALWERHS